MKSEQALTNYFTTPLQHKNTTKVSTNQGCKLVSIHQTLSPLNFILCLLMWVICHKTKMAWSVGGLKYF